MSLLTTATVGNASQPYFMENIGGKGSTAADAPCIKGTTLGTVRVGNPSAGVLIRGDTLATANRIAGGQTAGGSLTIGNSTTSFQNVVLTDNLTTINTPVSSIGGIGLTGDLIATGNVSVGDDLILAGGPTGGAISGYFFANVPVVGAGAVPNPPGLTNGVYFAIYIGTGAGNENAQPSGVFYYNSVGGWSGNAVSFNFTAGAPNCALGPVAGGATLNIGGAGVPAAGNVYFRKLLN